MSLPNLRAKVPRSIRIEVRYFTRDGEEVKEVLEGFLARIFQHEFDHLNGTVFIDRVESTKVCAEKAFRKRDGYTFTIHTSFHSILLNTV